MFDFFRRYQWYFILAITIMIVVSFSFFGTYNTIPEANNWKQQIAFQAINGKDISRHDLEAMKRFINTDSQDQVAYGAIWGFNFLNDGVIKNDFIDNGLIYPLFSQFKKKYPNELQAGFEQQGIRERSYEPYKHATVPFISAESSWNYFNPAMASDFHRVKNSTNYLDDEAFSARVRLFSAEKQISPTLQKQLLRYQERQYDWIKPDPQLDQTDLSLFGYHTAQEWFSPQFTELLSQFIINTAILAEEKGYYVSDEEVIADLAKQAELSYNRYKNHPQIGVPNVKDYYRQQLRLLGMDQGTAVNVWRQILLFRRYFADAGNNALIDKKTAENINQFSQEELVVDVYSLPKAMEIANFSDLQQFETYIHAIAKEGRKNSQTAAYSLDLPTKFLSVDELKKTIPALVEKRYSISLASVNKKQLENRITLKETWNWQLDVNNWEILTKKFQELASKRDLQLTKEIKLQLLEGLDPLTRQRVDDYTRKEIVKSHPEWIVEALNQAEAKPVMLGIRLDSITDLPIKGLSTENDKKAFMKLLDDALLNQLPTIDSPLYQYSADQDHFYRITVKERAQDYTILPFETLKKDGTLEKLNQQLLERFYTKEKEKSNEKFVQKFKDSDGKWKAFENVKNEVAEFYYAPLIAALEKEMNADSPAKATSGKSKFSFRFFPYVREAKNALIQNNDKAIAVYLKNNLESVSIEDQWRLEKKKITLNRQQVESEYQQINPFGLGLGAWSDIQTSPTGTLAFLQVEKRQMSQSQENEIHKQVWKQRELLSLEIQKKLAIELVNEMISKDAFSLDLQEVAVGS